MFAVLPGLPLASAHFNNSLVSETRGDHLQTTLSPVQQWAFRGQVSSLVSMLSSAVNRCLLFPLRPAVSM